MFRLLVQTVKDYAIFMLDPEGNVASWNEGAERIKGWRAEEIIGRHFSTFYPKEDIDAGKPEMELRVATAEGRFEDEGWRLRKDGTRIWANVVITAVWSEETPRRLIGFAKVTRDLTERRLAEESLRRSNQQLERYAAFVSHDLQEPLRKMASFAELLKLRYGGKLDDEADDYIRRIVDAAKRMRVLVTDVLEFSRLTQHKRGEGPVALDGVLAAVLRDLELQIREAGAEVAHAPLPRVKGDPVLLGRLLQNLVSNAIKFRSPDRRPKVEVAAEPRGSDWLISVADNGIGVEPQYTAAIFEPFKRLHSKEKYPGSGLGLAASKVIVESHAGRIWAEPRPGGGTTFKVLLKGADGAAR
ncbi:MAG: ATP-binding protein [Elusimicrobiota bacterium]|nr:MAG: ATP-binding protein [Elusimicrobiota bacterium]